MSRRRAPREEDQVVPKKGRTLFTYDPALEVLKDTIDPEPETYTETELGQFKVLQTVEKSGQGYYLLCKNIRMGTFSGPVLVKYLGGRNEITRQYRDYFKVGVSPAVATQIHLAEDRNNPEREIRFARELVHENIVKIIGFIAPDGKPDHINAIVMEGSFDGSLDVYASREQIPVKLVKVFALQLASALEYCHSLNILHRDVRTRNIYVQNAARIKLGNFGFAREADRDNVHTSNKPEEPYYCAPEMISKYATTVYSLSVDVYGFALVLWSMLHDGKKPFKDDPASEKLVGNEKKFRKYLEDGNRPKIDDYVDQGLATLIKRCWINETLIDERPSMHKVVETLKNM